MPQETRSVPPDGGATPVEAIVDARRDHINNLVLAVIAVTAGASPGVRNVLLSLTLKR
jgi:hypothetical protein